MTRNYWPAKCVLIKNRFRWDCRVSGVIPIWCMTEIVRPVCALQIYPITTELNASHVPNLLSGMLKIWFARLVPIASSMTPRAINASAPHLLLMFPMEFAFLAKLHISGMKTLTNVWLAHQTSSTIKQQTNAAAPQTFHITTEMSVSYAQLPHSGIKTLFNA
jgi:hypothetical protein